jgi:hypothetical protein
LIPFIVQEKHEIEQLRRREQEANERYGRAISTYLSAKVEKDLQVFKDKSKKQVRGMEKHAA